MGDYAYLPEYRLFPERKLYAVFPHGRHLPLKTRALIDFLVDELFIKTGRLRLGLLVANIRVLVVATIDVGESNRGHIKDTPWGV